MNTTRSMYGAPAASAPTNSIYGAASAAGQRAAPANSMYGGGGAQPAYPGAQNSMATMLAQKYPWMAPNLPTAVQGHPTGGVLQALPVQGAPVNPIYAQGGVPANMPYNAGGQGIAAGVPGNYGPSYGGNPYAERGPVMVSPAGAVNQPAAYGGAYAPNVTAAGNRVLAGNGVSGVGLGAYAPSINPYAGGYARSGVPATNTSSYTSASGAYAPAINRSAGGYSSGNRGGYSGGGGGGGGFIM
jgi:hypothetical protein